MSGARRRISAAVLLTFVGPAMAQPPPGCSLPYDLHFIPELVVDLASYRRICRGEEPPIEALAAGIVGAALATISRLDRAAEAGWRDEFERFRLGRDGSNASMVAEYGCNVIGTSLAQPAPALAETLAAELARFRVAVAPGGPIGEWVCGTRP